MPITTKDVFGEPAKTFKDQESAIVQVVEVNGQERLEARIYVSSDTYDGWGKASISFSDPAEAAKFLAAFAAAVDDFAPAPQAPKAKVGSKSGPPASTKPAMNDAALARLKGRTTGKAAAPRKATK
jgi:hypothetical protein